MAVGVGVAVFLVVASLYGTGYALTSDRLPRGVSVSGVDIGGQSPEAARQTLQQQLVPRAGEPITVRHAGRTFTVDPDRAGLSLDVAGTVRTAGAGHSLNPVGMIQELIGGEAVEPVVNVDHAAMDQAVARLAHRIERPPVEGSVRFRNGRATAAYPEPGIRLDKAATSEAMEHAFLEQQARAVQLPVDRVPTRLTHKDIQAALSGFAKPAMSGPVTVRAGRRSVRLPPDQIGSALTMTARHGRLVPRLNAHQLYRNARTSLAPLQEHARPATVELRNGTPHVVHGRTGTKIDPNQLAQRVRGVLRSHGTASRTVKVRVQPVRPEFDTADARDLGIKEVVSHFTTFYPPANYRNTNLGRAAEKINGTVLKPGDVFSLNRVVGQRTAANGFTKGYIIDNGMLVEDFGGGVSQVATTTYNAAFFAGLKDVEHNPHSIWFDRYPMGRESTVLWGSKDLRFQNNTPYGVLVQAWIKPSTPGSYGQMHVRMWSTHYWDVKAGLSDQYNFRKPSVRYVTAKSCVPETGYDGFDVDVYRYLSRNGHHVRTEKDHVSYNPLDTVHCHAPPQQNHDGQASSGTNGGG